MHKKQEFWYKLIAVILTLALLVPVLSACDDDDDDDATTAATTAAPSKTTPAATTAAPSKTTPAATTPAAGLTIEMSIGELLEDPDGEAALRKCLGDDIIDNPQMAMAFGMTVTEVSTMTDKVTDEMVACVEAGLSGKTAVTKEVPFVNDPVKIGAVMDFSGPAAQAGWMVTGVIKFLEWYYNEKHGGLLMGDIRRPVEFVTCDTKSELAQARSCAIKLLEENISAITMGGVSESILYPIYDLADPAGTSFHTFMDPAEMLAYKWTIAERFGREKQAEVEAKFIVEYLKPKTIAHLAYGLDTVRTRQNYFKDYIQDLDPNVKFVYKELCPVETTDFSSYITRIKYEKPDILFLELPKQLHQNLAQQVGALGGWGDIQVFCYDEAIMIQDFATHPALQGTYFCSQYIPGKGGSGATDFTDSWREFCEQDPGFMKEYSLGSPLPLGSHGVISLPMVGAVEAVKLAGSDDPKEVSKAARSGKLEFNSSAGYVTIGTDGRASFDELLIVQIQDGELVLRSSK